MKITVYGAASTKIEKKYIIAVEKLCEKLAKRDHSLVFGGGATGLMGAAARGFKRGGGKIEGIIPEFFRKTHYELLCDECDETIWTEDMHERKRLLENLPDAFIVTPGGIGTYDEFFGVLTDKQLDRHFKPIAVFNYDGFFDGMLEFIKEGVAKKFINESCLELFEMFDDDEKLIEYLEKGEENHEKKDYKNV